MKSDDAIEVLLKAHSGQIHQMDSLDAIELLMAIEDALRELPYGQRIGPLDTYLRELRTEAPGVLQSMLDDTEDRVVAYCKDLGE